MAPAPAEPDVAVLGGGVVGITAALALELAGHETVLHTAHVPFEDDGGPTLATTYAAASVYPAYVTMADLPAVFARSQAAFAAIAETGSMGLRRQPNFHLVEGEWSPPPYVDALEDVERVGDLDRHPRRTGAAELDGIRFTVYFAETPTYLAALYDAYRALGGTVERGWVDRDELADLPGAVCVNCAGYWARELVSDPRPMQAYVGHQVLANDLPPVRDPAGRPFSYSYTTDEDAPPDQAGLVYAYPREDVLVLGGSRIPAEVGPGEDWSGAIDGPTREVDGVSVPARLLETNADLLAGYAGVALADATLTARYGYRPVRDPDGEGVRLERDELDGRPIVHNYGHGGAGVTLSWGSASRVVGMVEELVGSGDPPEAAAVPAAGPLRSWLAER